MQKLKNLSQTIKTVSTTKPEISELKSVRVVNNPQSLFRLNRDEPPVKLEQKKRIVKKKIKQTKRKKRKPRKISFVIKPKSKRKKTQKRSKNEMIDLLKKRGITLSKPNDDMIEKLFDCVEDSGISIQKS